MIFLPLVALGGGILYYVYRTQADAAIAGERVDERRIAEIARQRIIGDLSSIYSRLRYLAEQETLQHWLANRDPVTLAIMGGNYVVMARSSTVYDMVRFIDNNGREIVRAARQSNGSVVRLVPEAELQAKVDTYYVPAILALRDGEIYVSPFDLYVERGVIEPPIKPTIRFGAPVFGPGGRKDGIVVVNVLGAFLLERMQDAAGSDRRRIWLLNGDGYWLRGPNAADEWAFMYPERRDRTIERMYPEVWRIIRAGGTSGQFFVGDELFTYANVPPRGSDSSPWIVLMRRSGDELAALLAPLQRQLTTVAVALIIMFALLAWVMAGLWQGRTDAARATVANEARFRSLLESAPDAVIVTDSAGAIQITNAAAERLFGYSRGELMGRRVEMLVPERLRGGHIGHRSRYAADPRARPMGAGLALVGLRRDGTEVPVSISLSPAVTDEGTLIFCDIRDVSDQRAAENQIRELNERLGRDNAELGSLNKELEAFSYSVSHDLRAPLRAIDGFSQALVEDYADRLDDTGRDYAARVRNAAQRMGHLIDDLLKLARVARAEMDIEDIDLSALSREIADGIARAEPGRSAAFTIAPGLAARGDGRLLRIVLENLLGNAWKFTAGAKPARIELGEMPHGDGKAYFVRDNGAGFDMTYAGKLFGAFQRLHDARDFPGTGIGLATVQRIVHKHGGKIWAEGAVGKGAAFYFTL